MEDEESELFIEVDCFNVEPVLSPAPQNLTQQQVKCTSSFSSLYDYIKSILKKLKSQTARFVFLFHSW